MDIDAAPQAGSAQPVPDHLALAAARGDRRAFEALVRAEYDRIHRFAWRCCRDHDRADDLVQDVLLKLARTIAGYRGDSRFSTYLYRLVVNTWIDSRRAEKRFQAAITEVGIAAAIETTGDDDALDRLVEAIHRLGPPLQETVLLICGEGVTQAEAALILGRAPGTIAWQMAEARKRLKSLLAEDAA
ncbi:MAG: RNA polymerase sigma factor [Hyphomicrobiaceae bacterium]|nr:RNA polymerase sigma factor [Hyphomicrobiaceae bacterium]